MSTEFNNPGKLAFSTRCLPGSLAEQKEQERLAEFHRYKAVRKAEEARVQSQEQPQRDEAYQAACEANNERMRQNKAARMSQNQFLRR